MALLAQSTIKITSPANDLVVRPGQTIEVQASVAGPFSIVSLTGPSTTVELVGKVLYSPPYLFHVTVPAASVPGRQMIRAALYASENIYPVVSDTLWLDVERPDSPQKITIAETPTSFEVGQGTILEVMGKFDEAGDVNLSRSSRTTFAAEPAGIVAIGKDGQVNALASGKARIIARYQDLQAVVNISVMGDGLTITVPAEGTVLHPGEPLSVKVVPLGSVTSVAVIIRDIGIQDLTHRHTSSLLRYLRCPGK